MTFCICDQGAAPGAVRVGIIGTGWGAKVGFAAAELDCRPGMPPRALDSLRAADARCVWPVDSAGAGAAVPASWHGGDGHCIQEPGHRGHTCGNGEPDLDRFEFSQQHTAAAHAAALACMNLPAARLHPATTVMSVMSVCSTTLPARMTTSSRCAKAPTWIWCRWSRRPIYTQSR